MKKLTKLLLFPLLGTLLIGCVNNNPPIEEPEQTYGEDGNPNAFSKTLTKLFNADFGTIIPFCPCVSYEYEREIDAYGDPCINTYFYFNAEETLERAYNYYAYLCDQDGWTVESGTVEGYDCVYADKVQITGKNDGVELCFLPAMKNDKYCLGVFGMCFLYEDENIYPSVAVEKLLGKDYAAMLPKVEGEGLTYSFMFSYEDMGDGSTYFNLRLFVYNAYVDDEENYFNALLANGFFIWNDLDMDDDEALPYTEYPGYEGGAYDAFKYNIRGNFLFGTYFTYLVMYNALMIDIFIVK